MIARTCTKIRRLCFNAAVLSLAFVVTIVLSPILVFAQFPGGFLEKATSTDIRATLTQLEIQALLPARGLFTFPPPYLTQGIRLTNESDCGGTDCVKYVGYSYWRNINNHSGGDEMLVFLTLRGNGGPTLFSYNKVTDAVTKLGPLFSAGSSFSSATGEGWYFSAAQPTTLYLNSGPKLLRYDVFTKQFETVFDVSMQPALFGANRIIWQMHSSNDDRVHSATLKDGTTYADLGCFAYDEALIQFYYYPKLGAYDECQIDKSGRWLLIKENVDGLNGEDNRIIDLQTGVETVLLDQIGAAGHSDNGFEYMVAADNWNILPGAIRMWKFGQNPLQGPVVYRDPSWATQSAQHVSHVNTKAGVPPEQQYACGSGARATNGPRANEIVCFRLDTSYDVLVVAPVMTDMNAPGGGDSYSKLPKGNLDVTGQYLIWTSNMASSRLDAFIVKIPAQLLTGLSSDATPPAVSVTSPLNGASVSNFITVSATASDNVGVAGVQFKLDGVNLGSEFTTSPYSISWNTTTATNASHTLTAVARDAAGNLATSSAVTVTVSNDSTPPVISSVAVPFITSSGVTITWTTDEASDSQVEYGPTTAYGSAGALNTSPVTSHSQALSGLAANTLYHYRVKSQDAAGNLATSGDFTFTTLASADTTPPTVSITSPVSGSAVSATITVAASASDNVAVVGVQFKLDGNNLGAEDAVAPYSISWNTTTATNGSHLLTAVARDAAGNSTTSTALTVTVNNDITAPAISLVSSSNISSSGSTITWTTNEASDSQVEYGLTTAYGSASALNTSPVTSHSQALSGLAANTLYHYRVKSRDAAGNLATSGDFTFTTLPPPPPDLVAYRTLTPITVDGVLGEWSGAGAARFSGLSNSATAYLLWNATNLYVAFQVTDTQLSAIQTARDAPALYQDDAVEVYLDTRADRTTTMQSDDYQFLVNLNNAQGDLRGTGGGKDPAWNATWLSAVTRQGTLNSHGDTDSGYTVEIAIPWAQIGVTPSIGMYLGMDLAVDDKDAATFNYFDWAGITLGSYAQPNLWKRIQLADAPPDTTPPSVAITSPSPGATVSGTITVSGTAADNVALSRVEVLVDSGAPQTASGTNVWNLTLNTLALSNGTHAVVARALDPTGNAGTATVSVTVSNDTTPPALSAVTASALTASGATITWTTDEASDSQVEYGLTTAYGSSAALNSTMVTSHSQTLGGLASNTLYHYRVKSRDAAGNLALSGDFTFTTPTDINAGLVGYWKFDEGSGASAIDSSGNGNTGTLVNGPTRIAAGVNQALSFDGVNDYVSIPHTDKLNAYPLTIALWMKTSTAAGVRGIVNKYVAGSYNGYQLFINNGTLCAWYLRNTSNYVYNGTGCTLDTAGYNDNRWHHVAFVVDASGGRLYVDGILTASQPWTGPAGAPSTTQELQVGHYPGAFGGAEYFQGAGDEVHIYNRALSAEEVLKLYNAAKPSTVENVVWINVVNATTTDNSLKKTSGCDGCQDAGAASQQQITSGNGYLEFMASETTTLRYAGLSNGNTGTSAAEIKFAVRLQSGFAEVRESGLYKADTSFVTGDVFRIAVESGVVKYYKNCTLFYTSTVAPVYPLLVDSSILSLNGTVTNAVIFRSP